MPKVATKPYLNQYPKLSISTHQVQLLGKSSHNTPANRLELTYQYKGREYQQKVAVTSTACNFGGSRYWWLCPKCGRRVGVLYCAGKLMYRHCIGLSYQSQLSQSTDLLFNRIIKTIRERLAWQAGIVHGHSTRPKGMHQATFTRLTIEHQQLQLQILGKITMFTEKLTSSKSKKPINEITLEDIIQELEFARTIAGLKGNANAMVAVSMAKAKLLGLDKGQIDEPLEPIFNTIDVTPDNFDENLNLALENCKDMMEKVMQTKPKKKSKKLSVLPAKKEL